MRTAIGLKGRSDLLPHDALRDHITSATAHTDCMVRHSTGTYTCVCTVDKVSACPSLCPVLSFDEMGSERIAAMPDEPHIVYLSGCRKDKIAGRVDDG